MGSMAIENLDQLLELREAVAADVETVATRFPGDGWVLRDGVVQHNKTDFFQLVGRRHPDGSESLLIRQAESALVGLGVAERDHGRSFLLNARAEPGLHGVCQFSSTIQSTPSNYERRHGGRETPFIEHFLDVPARRLLHHSWQYDLGSFYDRKTKQFTIVHFDEEAPAEFPLVWVNEADVRALLSMDQMVTSDLRVSIALLDAVWKPGAKAPLPPGPSAAIGRSDLALPADVSDDASIDVDISRLTNWVVDEHGIRERLREQGVHAISVRTTAGTREVTSWEQPLLAILDPTEVTLSSAVIDGERRFAIAATTQRGLAGRLLWHPAPVDAIGTELVRRALSAEGGRFWRHRITVVIMDLDAVDPADEIHWVTLSELAVLAASDLCTTVELRLALSLAQEWSRT